MSFSNIKSSDVEDRLFGALWSLVEASQLSVSRQRCLEAFRSSFAKHDVPDAITNDNTELSISLRAFLQTIETQEHPSDFVSWVQDIDWSDISKYLPREEDCYAVL